MNSSALMPLLAFGLVVALIPLALWLMKRSGLAGLPQNGLMRAVGSLALSPSQRVVVVELNAGDKPQWLVLGVSGERISSLAQMDAPATPPGAVVQPQATVVNQLIDRWRQGSAGGSDAR